MTYKCPVKYNKKTLARDLGDPSDGLQNPPLERINWNTEDESQDSP